MPVMDPDGREDLGEMYSPDDQGEYTSLDETPRFSLPGLSDALADIGEETGKTSVEEYALMLEVTMADRPGHSRILLECGDGHACSMCKWMALVLLTCSSTTSRAIGVWSRGPWMLSKPTWRRPFQSGSCTLPTSMSAFSL